MRYLNIDFEKEVDFKKLTKLFLVRFNEFKAAIGINFNLFSNIKVDSEKAKIFWDISEVDGYADIKLRSQIEFSDDVELPADEFILWLHMISIDLDSKIYVEIEILENPIEYSVAWCIDRITRSIVFDAEEIFEESKFAYCEPKVDMTKMLDL